MTEIYDKQYFEAGLESGKSLYNGFVWMPERSFVEAMAIIDACKLPIGCKILDYGSAKGYLVKALRLLGRIAYGCDVSRYAVCTSDPSIRQYMYLCEDNKLSFEPEQLRFDIVVAKDVFEHIDIDYLHGVIENLKRYSKRMFVVVPLGDGKGRFNVPEYNYDISHINAFTMKDWTRVFEGHAMRCDDAAFYCSGLKNNWAHHELGNGFFKLSWK